MAASKPYQRGDKVMSFDDIKNWGPGGNVFRDRVQTHIGAVVDELSGRADDIEAVQMANFREELQPKEVDGKRVDERMHIPANLASADSLMMLNDLNKLFQDAQNEWGPERFNNENFDIKFTYAHDNVDNETGLPVRGQKDIVFVEVRKGAQAGNPESEPTLSFSVPAPQLSRDTRQEFFKRATSPNDKSVQLMTREEYKENIVGEHLQKPEVQAKIEARDALPLEDVVKQRDELSLKLLKDVNLENALPVIDLKQLAKENPNAPKPLLDALGDLKAQQVEAKEAAGGGKFKLNNKPHYIEKPVHKDDKEPVQSSNAPKPVTLVDKQEAAVEAEFQKDMRREEFMGPDGTLKAPTKNGTAVGVLERPEKPASAKVPANSNVAEQDTSPALTENKSQAL